MEDKDLQSSFMGFTGGVTLMDGRSFVKMVKSVGLYDQGKLNTTDLDIIFAKVKDGKEKKIKFKEFLRAIEEISCKLGLEVIEVKRRFTSVHEPIYKGTVPDAVRFHDDKSTYTGVYKHGGPSTANDSKFTDLSELTNRAPASVRGVNLTKKLSEL